MNEHSIKCLKKIQFSRKFNFPDFLHRKCSSNMVLLEITIKYAMSTDKTILQSDHVSIPSSLAPCSVVANFSIHHGKIIKNLNAFFRFRSLYNNFRHAFPEEHVCMLHKSFYIINPCKIHCSWCLCSSCHDTIYIMNTSWLYRVMPMFLYHTSL